MIIRNGVRHNTSSFGGSGNANIVKLTQSEYDALPESKKSDGILYAITDGECSASGGSSKIVELNREQYEALGDKVNSDGILYAITDGDGLSAKSMAFDDTETQLGVNNVQDAIVEQNKKLDWNLHASNVVGGSTIELPEIWTELMVYLHNTQTQYVTEHHILKTYFDTFEPDSFNLASGYYYTTSEGSVLNFVIKKGENSIKSNFTHCGGNVNSSGLVTIFYK